MTLSENHARQEILRNGKANYRLANYRLRPQDNILVSQHLCLLMITKVRNALPLQLRVFTSTDGIASS